MADKKTKDKKEEKNLEREYTIPLREKCRPVPRYKKTNKAIKSVKEFLVKHMQIRDRDLKKIKLDNYVNEYLWARGIKNPPHKVKVKATRDINGIVNVELVDFPNKLKYKKLREEKAIKAAMEAGKKKKAVAEKMKQEVAAQKTDEQKSEEAEKKTVEKDKAKAGEEVAQVQAKQDKKAKQPKMKQPKRPQRKALAK